jgi:hypothetical protein
MDAAVQARRLVDSYQVSQAIHVAVVLGLPDRVAGGPRSADELASATGSHPRSLYRLMRALATVGVFHEIPDQRFQATELSDALRRASADLRLGRVRRKATRLAGVGLAPAQRPYGRERI